MTELEKLKKKFLEEREGIWGLELELKLAKQREEEIIQELIEAGVEKEFRCEGYSFMLIKKTNYSATSKEFYVLYPHLTNIVQRLDRSKVTKELESGNTLEHLDVISSYEIINTAVPPHLASPPTENK